MTRSCWYHEIAPTNTLPASWIAPSKRRSGPWWMYYSQTPTRLACGVGNNSMRLTSRDRIPHLPSDNYCPANGFAASEGPMSLLAAEEAEVLRFAQDDKLI